jgi:hypothetical protein
MCIKKHAHSAIKLDVNIVVVCLNGLRISSSRSCFFDCFGLLAESVGTSQSQCFRMTH